MEWQDDDTSSWAPEVKFYSEPLPFPYYYPDEWHQGTWFLANKTPVLPREWMRFHLTINRGQAGFFLKKTLTTPECSVAGEAETSHHLLLTTHSVERIRHMFMPAPEQLILRMIKTWGLSKWSRFPCNCTVSEFSLSSTVMHSLCVMPAWWRTVALADTVCAELLTKQASFASCSTV